MDPLQLARSGFQGGITHVPLIGFVLAASDRAGGPSPSVKRGSAAFEIGSGKQLTTFT